MNKKYLICLIVFIVGLSMVVNTTSATTITTDILDAKNVQLDKYTFGNPENFDDLFQVELSKHSFKQIQFLEIKKETYDSYLNDVYDIHGIIKKESINSTDFDGYLLALKNEESNSETFSIIFQNDDKYYEISSVNGDIEWNEHVEKDINLLLSAWRSKS